MKRIVLSAVVVVPLFCGGVTGQDGADEWQKRLAELDARFLPALAELARFYDVQQDPEATAFFCECALGFGSADEKLKELKKKWQDEVYYGRVRGGKVLHDTSPIERRTAELGRQYRALVDELVRKGTSQEGISDAAKRLLHDAVVKSELARGAHEYVQATQRFNELRFKMKLRAILWDFEGSRALILGGWYMGETGDYRDPESDKGSFYYTADVETAKGGSVRCPNPRLALSRIADEIRSYALAREDLANPDSRQLYLGAWTAGRSFSTISLYGIPSIDCRPDIATPSTRYARATVAEERDNWQDVEQTIKIADKRVIVVHYPYEGEPDAPYAFGDGKKSEHGWADPKIRFLRRCGLPIMLRFYTDVKLTDVKVSFRKAKGSSVLVRLYLDRDPRVALYNLPTVLILPEKHLDPSTEYSVQIKCKLNGVPFEKKWSFRTRAN
ncbi:MAG: hypothetical protein HYY16_15090 [Planctomycetes bacterium]|nr:hypothetical protein [Planctomycetota bacterium]